MRNLYPLALLLFTFFAAHSQNDFRSRQSGDWNDASTWEEFVGGSWQVTTNTPSSADGQILIRSGHSLQVTANVVVDQLSIEGGSTLSVSGGVVMTVADGAGVDVLNAGTITTPGEANLVFDTDAVYEHARNGGTIPAATWNAHTMCLVTGVTNTVPSGLNPAGGFYHFTWSCESQSTAVSFDGNLQNVNGNLTIANSNSNNVRLAIGSAPAPLEIGGDFVISGTTTRVAFTTSADLTINVGGTFGYYSTDATGLLMVNASGNGTVDLNIAGDFIMDAPGGMFRIGNGAGVGNIRIGGDFTLTAGTISETSSSMGNLFFETDGTQVFTNTGSISNTINYYVGPETTLYLPGESAISGTGSVTVDGALRLGSLNPTGAIVFGGGGNFAINSRIFNPGSRIIYGGTGPQFIGNGHPTAANVITEIDNPDGVTFNTTTTGNNGSSTTLIIASDLVLTSGNLNIESNGSVRVLSIRGDISGSGYITMSGTQTDLEILGSGELGTFPFPSTPQTFRNLRVNRSAGGVAFDNEVSITGTVTMTEGTVEFNNTTVVGNVSLDAGTVLSFDDVDLTISGNFTSSGGDMAANAGSTLRLAGGQVLTSPLRFTEDSSLGVLELNKTNSGISVVINEPLLVTTTLRLRDGRLENIGGNLTLENGATIEKHSDGRVTNTRPSGGPWHVVYTGDTQSTSLEIPASGNVLSFTVDTNSGQAVNLGQHTTVEGALTITASGGTLSCSSWNLIVGSIENSGTILAPSSNLTLNGTFVNNGTYTHRNGTLIISGDVTMSGTTIDEVRFFNVTINPGAFLTPSNVLLVQGNFTNNGTFNAGTGEVSFRGGTGSRTISGTSNTQFYNLDINKSAAGVAVSVTSPQTVVNALTLSQGNLEIVSNNLVMANGATITRTNNGQISGSSPGGGPWHLVYTGTSMSTGLEVPPSGELLSLTENMNSGTTLTIQQALQVENAITIVQQNVGPIFQSGTNSIVAGGLVNGGIFNAPTGGATLTLTGDFVNDRTFNHLNGTVIFDGELQIAGTINTVFFDFTVGAAGDVTVVTDFFVEDDFTNNGNLDAGEATITFSGSGLQTISGSSVTTFNNVNISNTSGAGVSIESNQNIAGTLTMAEDARLDADGAAGTAVLTIVSTNDSPAQDGAIAALPSSAVINGHVTVQRYFGIADDFDRFISSPVSGATIAQLQQAIPVTGKFTGTSYPCDGCGGNVANMWWYDESVAGNMQKGYVAIPQTGQTNQEVLVPGVGYDVFMWNGTAPVTINLRGPINRGTVQFQNLSHTVSAPPNSADGWNLVGNPYPSAIQWNDGAGWSRTNIDPTVWVWDVVGRVWHSYNANTQTGDLTDGIIATGQGFWVYAPTVGSASMEINEQAKSTSGSGAYYRKAPASMAGLQMTLSHGGFADNAWLTTSDQATEGYDPGLDAPKLQLGFERLSVAFVGDDRRRFGHYAINSTTETSDIVIAWNGEADGTYLLSFEGNDFPEFDQYYLVDKVVQTSWKLSDGPYEFTGTRATQGSERFLLSKHPMPGIEDGGEIKVTCFPNPATEQINIEVYKTQVQQILLLDNLGHVVKRVETKTNNGITTGTVSVADCRTGVYFVRIVSPEGVAVKKVVKY